MPAWLHRKKSNSVGWQIFESTTVPAIWPKPKQSPKGSLVKFPKDCSSMYIIFTSKTRINTHQEVCSHSCRLNSDHCGCVRTTSCGAVSGPRWKSPVVGNLLPAMHTPKAHINIINYNLQVAITLCLQKEKERRKLPFGLHPIHAVELGRTALHSHHPCQR